MTTHIFPPEHQNPQAIKGPYVFPAKLLALSMFLTLVVVVWMGGNSVYIHHFLTHNIARDQQLAEMADEILYLDSVITQLARAPTTGDAEFDKRYMDAIKEELNKKVAALPDKALQDVVHATDQANNKIIALDRQYLDLINQNRLGEAERIIHGVDYANNNKLHLDGRRRLAEKIRQVSHQNLLSLENDIYTTLSLVTVVIVVIFVAWYYAFRSVRRWREELEDSRSRETQAKEEAETANATLILSEQVAKKSAMEAEKANYAKSEFLTNMSHELRTPMHAILGFSRQVLKRVDTAKDEKLAGMVANIQVSGGRLLNLLNALLDLSKLEAGMMDFNFRREDIRKAINQTLLEIDSLLHEKQIQIAVHDDGTPKIMDYDYKSMVQVFMNLLSNAIKFSPAGAKITITLSETSTALQKPALLCRVQDNGMGIPENELDLVFDKFVQSSKTKSGAGGTGLGLAIARQVVEAHHGKIWAENIVPHGVCFNLLLPYEHMAAI